MQWTEDLGVLVGVRTRQGIQARNPRANCKGLLSAVARVAGSTSSPAGIHVAPVDDHGAVTRLDKQTGFGELDDHFVDCLYRQQEVALFILPPSSIARCSADAPVSGALECVEQRRKRTTARCVLEQDIYGSVYVRLKRGYLFDAADDLIDQAREIRIACRFLSEAAYQAALDVQPERLTPPLWMIWVDRLDALGEACRESVALLNVGFADCFLA